MSRFCQNRDSQKIRGCVVLCVYVRSGSWKKEAPGSANTLRQKCAFIVSEGRRPGGLQQVDQQPVRIRSCKNSYHMGLIELGFFQSPFQRGIVETTGKISVVFEARRWVHGLPERLLYLLHLSKLGHF